MGTDRYAKQRLEGEITVLNQKIAQERLKAVELSKGDTEAVSPRTAQRQQAQVAELEREVAKME